jgi:4-amino-4-deoxy-L-arabinose transferase-like glycosyltransferase
MGSVSLRSILVAALLLRLASACVHAVHAPEPGTLFDERSFFLVARALVEEGRLATRPGGPAEVIRGPAYPVFLVPFVMTTGQKVIGPALAQAVLGTATVWIVAAALLRLLQREGADERDAARAARLAAWACALSPIAILWDRFVMSESLATFLLAAAVALAWEIPHARRPLLAVLACGACCAALVLAKPAFLFLPVALAPFLVGRGRTKHAVALVAVTAALLVPWALRNAAVVGRPSPTGLGSGLFLYAATLPRASDGVPVIDDPRDQAAAQLYLAHDTPVALRAEADADFRRRALLRIRDRPFAYLASWIPRAVRLWTSSHAEALQPLVIPRPLRVVLALAAGAVFLTALSALLLGGPARSAALALMVAPLYTTLVHLPLAAGSRYSVPAWPFVWGLAALAVAARRPVPAPSP